MKDIQRRYGSVTEVPRAACFLLAACIAATFVPHAARITTFVKCCIDRIYLRSE